MENTRSHSPEIPQDGARSSDPHEGVQGLDQARAHCMFPRMCTLYRPGAVAEGRWAWAVFARTITGRKVLIHQRGEPPTNTCAWVRILPRTSRTSMRTGGKIAWVGHASWGLGGCCPTHLLPLYPDRMRYMEPFPSAVSSSARAHRPARSVSETARGTRAKCGDGVRNAMCCYLTPPSTRSSLSSFPMYCPVHRAVPRDRRVRRADQL